MTDLVLIDQIDDIAVVKINRPEVHNCINADTAKQLDNAWDRLEQDDSVRTVILTGAGDKSFSTGLDLKVLAEEGPAMIPKVIFEETGWAGIGKRFFPKPLIAAVNGYALAGGLELALSCDFIVASDQAELGFNEVTLGPIADAGACFRLPQWVPLPFAKEMLLTGKPISAEKAFQAGLVNHVVPQEELLDFAISIARQIGKNSVVSMGIMKKLVNDTLNVPESEAWVTNDKMMLASFETEAFLEGPRAFAEKREAVFSGK